MFKRAILGLVPAGSAIAVCAIVAMVGIGAVWVPLRSQHPSDPSLFDTVAWIIIYAAPLWIPSLLIIFMVTWTIAFLVVRRHLRLAQIEMRTTPDSN
jgi:hypothetical protein